MFLVPICRPKNKFIRITKDDSFSADLHYLSNTPAKAEAACAYDLDQCDEAWLRVMNGERAMVGAGPVSEEQFERVVEELEVSAFARFELNGNTSTLSYLHCTGALLGQDPGDYEERGGPGH